MAALWSAAAAGGCRLSLVSFVAQAMSANLGYSAPVTGLTLEEAVAKDILPAWVLPPLMGNIQMDSGKAARVLGWRPAPRPGGMLEDIRSGSYKKK